MTDATIEFKVFSDVYGVTDAVIDSRSMASGFCNCGDGSYYQLTRHEIGQLNDDVTQDSFIPSSTLPTPINLVALLRIGGEFRMEIPQDIKFDKKQYAALKAVVLKAGGEYSKNGFDFSESAELVYDRIVGGEDYNLKKKFQFYATQPTEAKRLVELSEIKSTDDVCEPSAGDGAIVKAINEVYPSMKVSCYETMSQNRAVLEGIDTVDLIGDDFLNPNGTGDVLFDKIIANPPFSNNQDLEHVRQMYSRLKQGGRLVSITSKHWVNSTNKKETAFREWLDSVGAQVLEIEEGAFKASGTNIGTQILVINKVESQVSTPAKAVVLDIINEPVFDLDELENDIKELQEDVVESVVKDEVSQLQMFC